MSDQVLPEKSLGAVHFNRRNLEPDRPLIIARRKDGVLTDEWHTVKRGPFLADAEYLAAAMMEKGIQKGDHVAIFSGNRPCWPLAASGIINAGAVIVPVYPSLTRKEAGYIVAHSDAKMIFVAEKEHLQKILDVRQECPLLRTIVVFDPLPDDPDGRYISLAAFLKRGKEIFNEAQLLERIRAVEPEDLAAIIYTSGTTGVPKGVMLTNANFLSQRVVTGVFGIGKEDTWLSHLPLCHSFGFTADYLGCMDVGGTFGMSEGLDPDRMREALTAVRPTVLMSVPRLYEKLYIRVLSILQSRPQRVQNLFWSAHKVGLEVFKYKNAGKSVPITTVLKYKMAKVILHKVREQAGLDRIRMAYGGGGPLAKELMAFFNGLGIDIYQGYGLTETTPIATVTVPGDNVLGTIGRPIKDVEIKLDEDGEILIKGPNVMKGYYKDPKGTADAFTEDGYFRSGDIGRIDDTGRITITDRKKELIITSAGKNIAPLPIETAFNTDPYIERVILIGDNRNYLTALISPNLGMLNKWAKDKGLTWSNERELVTQPETLDFIQSRVDLVNKDLARFETIKKFTLLDHEFSEENGILTPSQKVKRRIVLEKYKNEINAMYEEA